MIQMRNPRVVDPYDPRHLAVGDLELEELGQVERDGHDDEDGDDAADAAREEERAARGHGVAAPASVSAAEAVADDGARAAPGELRGDLHGAEAFHGEDDGREGGA